MSDLQNVSQAVLFWQVVKDDLVKKIKSGSRVSIAAACFSIYAYQTLKDELENCEEFRFIFTSPTFVAEKTPKERKEFYIPRLHREKSLYGAEFEVLLEDAIGSIIEVKDEEDISSFFSAGCRSERQSVLILRRNLLCLHQQG